MNQFYARPELPPPVSEWRRKILRICAEDRALRRASPTPAAPRWPTPAASKATPKRVRRPRVAKPPPQPKPVKPLCACGLRKIGKPGALACSWCRQHPCSTAAGRRCCASGCRAKLIRTNTTGLCKKHARGLYRKQREIAQRGPRPVCTYQADGMRCTQKLYRDNAIGLCCFHSGRQMGSEYRHRQPHMEPLKPLKAQA